MFRNRVVNPKFLINMEETELHLNFKATRIVHITKKTVAVNIGDATSSRFTRAVSTAMDATKLPLFVKLRGRVVEK